MRIRTFRFAVLLLSAGIALACFARAQSTPTCTVNSDFVRPNCDPNKGWLIGETCVHKTVSCSSVNGVTIQDLGITFGYLTPRRPKGTIIFFSQSGGTTPGESGAQGYPGTYYSAGFQVVQTAWDSDWEDTGTLTKNIAYAAGRVAALLGYMKSNLYDPIHFTQPSAGMCAQGSSGGSAAIAYALAWYNAGSYLDKAVMASGPPLSDVAQGCDVNGSNPLVTVCPAGQLGCNSANNPPSWTAPIAYTDARTGVREWSDDVTLGPSGVCRRTHGNTSVQASLEWKAMSIADGTIGTFNYPQTNLTAWLCSSVSNHGTMNDSSSEAQLFFQNFTSPSQTFGLQINGVSHCAGPEGVSEGIAPQGETGRNAIEADMIASCVAHH